MIIFMISRNSAKLSCYSDLRTDDSENNLVSNIDNLVGINDNNSNASNSSTELEWPDDTTSLEGENDNSFVGSELDENGQSSDDELQEESSYSISSSSTISEATDKEEESEEEGEGEEEEEEEEKEKEKEKEK